MRTEREKLESEYQRLQGTTEMSAADFHSAVIDWIADYNVERGLSGASSSLYVAGATWVSQNLGRKTG